MMVTFVSQCEKKAHSRTRRVLDAFADRIGDNTWQTVITQDGLLAVKKLLRKTASKNTAVSCHWIRSRSRTELVWVVGNKNKFNEQGVVPVNFTENAIDQYMDNGKWQTLEVIKYAAAIAGLFHDFGKANVLFQKKLAPKEQKYKKENDQAKSYEPYRHEWVSLRLFQAFVSAKTDEVWLEALSQVEKDQSITCFRDGMDTQDKGDFDKHPLQNLPPFAQLVAWLILSHHKLPLKPGWKDGVNSESMAHIGSWFETGFDAIWNSYNCKDADIKSLIDDNWKFSDFGLPYQSMKWRSHACVIASEAKTVLKHLDGTGFLQDNIFTSHLARLSLMLADHYYSAQDKTEEWQNPNYKVYANTDKATKAPKQQLDEHLIGVAYHAKDIVKALPHLNASSKRLRSLPENAFLEGVTPKAFKEEYGWQDDAKKMAFKLSESSSQQGFFGINMASTGKGKTLANAKIMYALGEKTGRRRFSVALGLRTLTLQTGREYRTELDLNDEQLAIAVGGMAVKQLFESAEQNKTQDEQEIYTGSESQYDYLDPDLYVDYEGSIQEHSLSKWTKDNPRIEKLIQAPVLVCTIDHLVPATDGTRGGKQIAPMLRLLTSDLVIDEPDDFGLDDLPALCRLVHWAGMLGSRVLLSTATMPPALAYAAFEAYQAGWSQYAKANLANWNGAIACAWVDEKNNEDCSSSDFESFKKAHKNFVAGRKAHLENNDKVKHKAEIVPIDRIDQETVYQTVASVIQQSALQLHQYHGQEIEQKHVSIGLVRMANINPLVAVAKELLKHDAPDDTCIHYCVYHSRYPLAIRSYIEEQLDKILARKDPQAIFKHESINKILSKHPQQNHIFVVLASPVAEVGRDHDYDWAIIEPSSMRSIIQIAGRVLRHRNKTPEQPNILLLSKNYKALAGKPLCYERPGFESKELPLARHDLASILKPSQYQQINAVERIILPAQYNKTKNGKYMNLIELEHKALALQLFAGNESANIWWKNTPYWCGEIQRQQRFRNSKKDEAYYLWLTDELTKPYWKWKNEQVYPPKFGEALIVIKTIHENEIELGSGSQFWFDLSVQTIYSRLARDFNIDLKEVSMRFGEVRITEYDNNQQEYYYYQNFGIYQEIGY